MCKRYDIAPTCLRTLVALCLPLNWRGWHISTRDCVHMQTKIDSRAVYHRLISESFVNTTNYMKLAILELVVHKKYLVIYGILQL